MKISWNDTAAIEAYLCGTMSAEDQLLFEARLLLQPELKENLHWQRRTMEMVKQYSRKKLKEELQAIHHQLFNAGEHRGFRQKILSFFKD